MREKVVLAYSGGLDTSIIIPWLKENYNCDVVAMIADVGQGDDIDAVVEKARKTGAAKVVVEDLRDDLVLDGGVTAVGRVGDDVVAVREGGDGRKRVAGTDNGGRMDDGQSHGQCSLSRTGPIRARIIFKDLASTL